MIHRASVTVHVNLLFTNISFTAVLLISLLSRFFMVTFRMFFFCYYNIVKIRSALGLPLFLTILYNRKWVFKCVHTAKSTLLKYWRHYSVLYLIVWNPNSSFKSLALYLSILNEPGFEGDKNAAVTVIKFSKRIKKS